MARADDSGSLFGEDTLASPAQSPVSDAARRARQPLAALGTVIAAFDNEPIHINSYFVHFTDAQCVHMLTDDSARGIAPHQSIPSIRDFRRG